ncbi:MAG: InlB B-repeat-containing protein [Lachnospiraceae bacterium]|nr:InlB B-repeat-containing protein [Lachnospiraceae bacterium]
MKNRMRKIIALLLALVLVIPIVNEYVSAKAAEPLPTQLEAPSIVLYDNGNYNSSLYVKTKNPQSMIDFYEKAYMNRYYADENGGDTNDYYIWTDFGEYYMSSAAIQLDYKVDDGEWHYESDWDENSYNCDAYSSFSGSYVNEVHLASISSYTYGIGEELKNLGCAIETTDGSSTYYRFDTENHSITVRARYIVAMYDHDYNKTIILSPWSNTTSLGNGNKDVSSAVTDLGTSTISNLRIDEEDDYYGAPQVKFDILPDEKVIDALQWSEQYDEALEDSYMYLIAETSLDPNFAEGSVIHRYNFYESSASKPWISYDSMFYDLWEDLPDKDQSAFNWNGETVYLRTKYKNERTVSGNDSSIESAYSNVLSIQGPITPKYDITIIHNDYGFDKVNGYYSESYSITEGRSLHTVYCAPLEGCYVQTVEVNGVVKYDKDDESTYELLDWYYDYEEFDFNGEEDIASENLTIEITYAGTPTAQYGITTECGTGGYLYTDVNYVSWDDNSLVVYHSMTPTITINPYSGYEIEEVVVDGVVNEEAKENGEYTFEAITDDTHSIEVTFKRVAYKVDSYAYHGTITTDYEGYNSSNEYVKIGDDITFTFAPAQDGSGHYYEIEKVYIDYVLNEEAKNSGTYTFENVQAEHDISVYYSDDPVITHDITATSGEHGNISPEGVIHAREGSTRKFDFIPDDGYEVDKVFVDNVEITNLASKEYYNIANITEEHTIHVTFKKLPVQYDVNVIVSGHNPSVHTVNPKGVTPVWEGESFTVNYSAFVGYEVEKVLVNGSVVDTSGTYSIANVSSDCTIEIFFKIKSYTVTFVDYNNAVLKTETVEHGSQATPPANPTREHYVFNGWDTNYNDVTTNVTIKATYSPAQYTVKFVGWNGTVLKTETVEYTNDATAPEAPAREGYNFSHWSLDYTNVSSNLEVVAVYVAKEYTVTFVDSDGAVLSTQTVKHGEGATAPANPTKEGYTFIGWDINTYSYVTSDMTITAQYVEGIKNIYTITANAYGTYGTVSPAGVSQIVEEGSLLVHFYPDEFSKIVRVVVDGEDVAVSDSYNFENVMANHTVDVYFAPTATINIKNDEIENGTVLGNYQLIDDQMAYVLDVTADDGYVLDGIYINGVLTTPEIIGGQYVIRNLTDDMDIKVTFKEISTNDEEPSKDTEKPTEKPTDTPTDKDEDVSIGDKTEDKEDDTTKADKSDVADKNESPQTGDTSNMFVWFIMLAIAVFIVAVPLRKKSLR